MFTPLPLVLTLTLACFLSCFSTPQNSYTHRVQNITPWISSPRFLSNRNCFVWKDTCVHWIFLEEKDCAQIYHPSKKVASVLWRLQSILLLVVCEVSASQPSRTKPVTQHFLPLTSNTSEKPSWCHLFFKTALGTWLNEWVSAAAELLWQIAIWSPSWWPWPWPRHDR